MLTSKNTDQPLNETTQYQQNEESRFKVRQEKIRKFDESYMNFHRRKLLEQSDLQKSMSQSDHSVTCHKQIYKKFTNYITQVEE